MATRKIRCHRCSINMTVHPLMFRSAEGFLCDACVEPITQERPELTISTTGLRFTDVRQAVSAG